MRPAAGADSAASTWKTLAVYGAAMVWGGRFCEHSAAPMSGWRTAKSSQLVTSRRPTGVQTSGSSRFAVRSSEIASLLEWLIYGSSRPRDSMMESDGKAMLTARLRGVLLGRRNRLARIWASNPLRSFGNQLHALLEETATSTSHWN